MLSKSWEKLADQNAFAVSKITTAAKETIYWPDYLSIASTSVVPDKLQNGSGVCYLASPGIESYQTKSNKLITLSLL